MPRVTHLAPVTWRDGVAEGRKKHLTTATAMYRKMEMRGWLEKAERETNKFAS